MRPAALRRSLLTASLLPLLLASSAFGAANLPPYVAPPPGRQEPMLSPEEFLKTVEIADGYRLELVLSEPDIKEPVAISFDGDGRLYVVEMRTYMQDADATGEQEARSRISRHESTKGDGRYDKHIVYADNLLLPRMVLPLQDDVLIGLTNTLDITALRDTNGDGVSDQSKPFFEGGPRGGNMEHQPSGLMWALDNRIYTTYNSYRLRWSPGGVVKEPTAANGGQWGLSQDDWGKIWFSNAGGEKGAVNFQMHIAYGGIDLPKIQHADDWMTVWPVVGYADVQSGPHRHRADGTLNHFSASCGQEIVRGDRLPADLRGDLLLPEPVGRLIRRGKVSNQDGLTVLTNPYPESEFIRSKDPNFRPINVMTGPDGCVYITDMYRGIIQQGNWTKPGSYLRPAIERHGLQNNIGRGRVWRLVHQDFKPGPQPKMLGETSAQLVAHLSHPNGWWRDMAQRLLVVRQDRSVGPALKEMALKNADPLARVHALWTLEGLGLADAALVSQALADKHPRVRENALRLTESVFLAGDKSLEPKVKELANDPDPNVVLQAVGLAKRLNLSGWQPWAQTVVATSTSKGVQEIGKVLIATEAPVDISYSPAEVALLKKGAGIYQELCAACHGPDGKGAPLAGGAAGATLAPPLSGSKTVNGHRDGPLLVLLHGLSGPVNGKAYDAPMVSMAANPDEWIAAIASHVRVSFNNKGGLVSVADVKRLRAEYAKRTEPWTEASLRAALPAVLKPAKDWKLSASHKPTGCDAAADGKLDTRWDTAVSQAPGQWFQIELPADRKLSGVRLDAGKSANDFPRGYKVELSEDGKAWSKPVAEGKGSGAVTDITWNPAQARFVRITQTGAVQGKFWSISEFELLAAK